MKALISSPLGKLLIETENENLKKLWFVEDDFHHENDESSPLLKEAADQIQAYFAGKLRDFCLPLDPDGTDFQKKVWAKLLTIPYGTTTSYLKMAEALGDPLVIRAAAAANGKNPIGIIIPCHRVIGSNNSLVGYAGGLWRKKELLKLEKNYAPKNEWELF